MGSFTDPGTPSSPAQGGVPLGATFSYHQGDSSSCSSRQAFSQRDEADPWGLSNSWLGGGRIWCRTPTKTSCLSHPPLPCLLSG